MSILNLLITKNLRLAVFAVFATAAMNAQDLKNSEVPQSFTDGLLKVYPTATDIEWQKNGIDYKVEFEVGNMDYEIWFSVDGKIVRVEKEITSQELPTALADIIKRDYPDHRIDSVEAAEKNGETTYEVELEKSWDEVLKITFTTTGRVLNVTAD